MSESGGRYAQAYDLGVRMADLLLDQLGPDEEPPFQTLTFPNDVLELFVSDESPLPESPEQVPAFVDVVAPRAVDAIGTMMATQAGGPRAYPKAAIAAIEQGFRARLGEAIIKALSLPGEEK